MNTIKYIVIHCTAASGVSRLQNVLNYWRSKGWKHNGYHWLVSRNGVAVRLQGDHMVANGVRGHNSHSIHLCYHGGENKMDTRTEMQKMALRVLVEEYKEKYPNAEVLGHRDLSPDLNGDGVIERHEWVKDCPCFDAKAEYADV